MISGTDVGGNAQCRHGMNAVEMVMLADAGMSNVEALRAGTSVSTDALGLKDCGRIAVGMPADIVISARDIPTDIQALADPATIASVFRGGRVVAVADPEIRNAFDLLYA
jgi:imidazolonepropionase-like amidohydrolase